MTIEGEFLRGAGPVAVLKLLERGEMYGYEIVEALERRTDGVLALGQSTLYPMLYNLEAKGFVAARWDEETAARPPKTWHRLTTAMGALGLTRHVWPNPPALAEVLR
jgi:PadR family transcriptional regulator PadR